MSSMGTGNPAADGRYDAMRVTNHQELGVLHSRITATQQRIAALVEEQRLLGTSLHDDLQRANNLIASMVTVRSVPNEILFMVFKLSADDVPSNDGKGRSPIQISRVCKRWREISLASPTLWTNMDIDFRDHPFSTCSLYLSRSADLHLNIRLDLRIQPHLSNFLANRLRVVLTQLIASSARWQSFVARCIPSDMMTILTTEFSVFKIPNLAHLELGTNPIARQGQIPILDAGPSSLTSLRLHNSPVPRDMEYFRGLTDLQINYTSGRYFGLANYGLRSIIGAAPLLKHLHIMSDLPVEREFWPRRLGFASIPIPSLLTLTIGHCKQVAAIDICASFSTPRLETLVLHNTKVSPILLSQVVCYDIGPERPRYPALKRLYFSGVELRRLEVLPINFARATPSLETLSLNNDKESDDFILQYIHHQAVVANSAVGQSAIWPNLKTLYVTSGLFTQAHLDALVNSRRRVSRPIERIIERPAGYVGPSPGAD